MEWLGDIMGPGAKSATGIIDYHGQKPYSKCATSIKTIG